MKSRVVEGRDGKANAVCWRQVPPSEDFWTINLETGKETLRMHRDARDKKAYPLLHFYNKAKGKLKRKKFVPRNMIVTNWDKYNGRVRDRTGPDCASLEQFYER